MEDGRSSENRIQRDAPVGLKKPTTTSVNPRLPKWSKQAMAPAAGGIQPGGPKKKQKYSEVSGMEIKMKELHWRWRMDEAARTEYRDPSSSGRRKVPAQRFGHAAHQASKNTNGNQIFLAF